MLTSSGFRELLNLFEKHNIRYLVVGGYAVMKYSEPRFTKDHEGHIYQRYPFTKPV